MSDDVIEHAQQLLQPKIHYVRQLKTALDAEARLKQRVKDLRTDLTYATSESVQTALDAATSSTQQALEAAKEATKRVRQEALTEGGWTRSDLAQLGLIATRSSRKRRKSQDTSGDDDGGEHDHASTLEPDIHSSPDNETPHGG